MKARMNIRGIIFIMASIFLASMFLINICFATTTGKILVESANLREEPNTEAEVLESLSKGTEVEIIEEADGWDKVKYNNLTGYIKSDLIETSSETLTENITTSNTVEETTEQETTETETTEDTIQLGKNKIKETIKLKIIPLINAMELDEVAQGTEVDVTEIINDWAKVQTTDGKQGWVRTDKLETTQIQNTETEEQEENKETAQNEEETTETETTENEEAVDDMKTMYISSETVNLRAEASQTANVITQLSINTKVMVLSEENGWCYVDVDGTKGYIAETLLSDTKQETSRSSMNDRTSETTTSTEDTAENTSVSTTNTSSTTSTSSGSAVVEYAKQFLGSKYVYGGTTPSGFDCSGFTQYVYKHFGISINRTAAAQYSNGTSVTDLQAGDLVMFGKSGINHVGIYMGGGKFIHAANANRGVTTDTLLSGYYKTNYVGARRVL